MLRRAVFSDYQRKGLEKRFQVQKYISKPDRKKLAEKLGLKDSQVRGKEADSLLEHPPNQGLYRIKGRYGIATRKMFFFLFALSPSHITCRL